MKLREGFVALKTIRSADGLRELVIFRRPDGLFGFAGERITDEDGDSFWEPAEQSGIYDSEQAAEKGAIAEIDWLSGKAPN